MNKISKFILNLAFVICLSILLGTNVSAAENIESDNYLIFIDSSANSSYSSVKYIKL